jgi:hypothetical protein
MVLQDILETATDYTNISVVTNVRGEDIELAIYDGKNAIPVRYNELTVKNISIGGDNDPTLIVEVGTPGEVYLALRLNTIIRDYDPYSYRDAEINLDICIDHIINSPVDTIDYLMDIIENMKEEKNG